MRIGKQAIIIGASSGIGAALARVLVRDGWRVLAGARRMDCLQELADELGDAVTLFPIDLKDADAAQSTLAKLWRSSEPIDLVVVSAGTGHVNPELAWQPEQETLAVNVVGFAAVAGAAMRLFLAQGFGHLAGITSVARFRGSGEAPAYGASKAFVSVYLDSLRDAAKQKKLPVYVTELCPGYVDTAMMQTAKPFWVVSPEKAASLMLHAIQKKKKIAYISPRWAFIAWILRLLPRP